MIGYTRCFVALFLYQQLSKHFSLSFTTHREHTRPRIQLHAEEEGLSPRQQQERRMEELSQVGSDKINSLDISERVKRAMLAEAVEDRISELTEDLESCVDNGTIPESKREYATELAQQIKVSQTQYQELVSGEPSSVVNAVNAATNNSTDAE